LDHLLKKAGVEAKERGQLIQGWHVEDDAAANETREQLIEHLGDELYRLEHEWSFEFGRALGIWEYALHEGRQWSAIESQVAAALKRNGAKMPKSIGESIAATPVPDSLSARVARVHATQDGVAFTIHILRKRTFRQEEKRKTSWETVPVEVEVPAKRTSLVRVYSSPGNSRAALRQLSEWLWETPVESGRGQSETYTAVEFKESHVHQMTKALKMPLAAFATDHSSGKNGKVIMEGISHGGGLKPVDFSDEDVKKHAQSPGIARAFNYTYTHADGFEEHGRVNFKIKYKPTHLEFPVKTSRSAMSWLVGHLLDTLKR
jgi:hypothetical protein